MITKGIDIDSNEEIKYQYVVGMLSMCSGFVSLYKENIFPGALHDCFGQFLAKFDEKAVNSLLNFLYVI
jgi:hypothetical protein